MYVAKPMTATNYEPDVQIRCSDCGRVHYDSNFDVCRECGAML